MKVKLQGGFIVSRIGYDHKRVLRSGGVQDQRRKKCKALRGHVVRGIIHISTKRKDRINTGVSVSQEFKYFRNET